MRDFDLSRELDFTIKKGGGPLQVCWEIIDAKNLGNLDLERIQPGALTDKRLLALFSALVLHLADETGQTPPEWALADYYLDKPWMLTTMESFMPIALRDSPPRFRAQNIFVTKSFLMRA